MIPVRYREMLPPYWYENEVAQYHFEGGGGEIDLKKEKTHELGRQFLLPYATYGLDVWDWLFFKDIQFGTNEERRSAIRRRNLEKSRFTLEILRAIGNEAGGLSRIDEAFSRKEIDFYYNNPGIMRTVQLLDDFAKIRPVHVKAAVVTVERDHKAGIFLGSFSTQVKIRTLKPKPIDFKMQQLPLKLGSIVQNKKTITIYPR